MVKEGEGTGKVRSLVRSPVDFFFLSLGHWNTGRPFPFPLDLRLILNALGTLVLPNNLRYVPNRDASYGPFQFHSNYYPFGNCDP